MRSILQNAENAILEKSRNLEKKLKFFVNKSCVYKLDQQVVLNILTWSRTI